MQRFGVCLGYQTFWKLFFQRFGEKKSLHQTRSAQGIDCLDFSGGIVFPRANQAFTDIFIRRATISSSRPIQRRVNARSNKNCFLLRNNFRDLPKGIVRIRRQACTDNRETAQIRTSNAPSEIPFSARIETRNQLFCHV